ncbi:MAG: hypothetical protein GY777_01690 [Candidatus Brocadiaceae bacterium]|nr:hypothetical protein [Candidatus Brocadiaceae bacterium]
MVDIFNFVKEKYLLFLLVLSIFQIYILKISNSYFSLYCLSAIALLPLLFINIKLLKWRPFFWLSLLFVIILLSSLWAIEIKELIKNLLWIAIALSMFCYAYKTSLFHKELVLKYITIYYYFLMAIPIIIVTFRLCPNIELTFLTSFISKIFINPNIDHGIFHGIKANILDPKKAGGFFPNANVAGAYLGINYFIARSFYTINNERKYLIFCVIIAIGIFATGSKGAVLIWIILNIPIILGKKKYCAKILTWSICLLLIYCVMIFLKLHHWVFDVNFIDRIILAIIPRIEVLDFAYSNIYSHWLLGFGFGGWKKEIMHYETIHHIDAPHNTLIALWANSGINAVIIGLFFIYNILKFGYKLTKVKDTELNRLGYGVILSFLFCFIQGMGENYGLIGEEHMSIILFIFLGYVYAQKKQQSL